MRYHKYHTSPATLPHLIPSQTRCWDEVFWCILHPEPKLTQVWAVPRSTSELQTASNEELPRKFTTAMYESPARCDPRYSQIFITWDLSWATGKMLDGEESGKVSSYTCVMAQAVKNPSAGGSLQMGHRKYEFDPWVGKIPWRRAGQPTPVSLPREFHGKRSLVG